MNRSEIGRLLSFCAGFDRRTIGDADILAWHAVLEHLDYDQAITAATAWYGEHSEPVMPADLRRQARGSETDRHPAYRQLKDAVAEAEKAAGGTELPALPAAGTPRLGPEQARAALAAALDRVAKTMKIPDPAPTGYVHERQRHSPRREPARPMPRAAGDRPTICHGPGCATDIQAPEGWDFTKRDSPPLYCGDACRKAGTAVREGAA